MWNKILLLSDIVLLLIVCGCLVCAWPTSGTYIEYAGDTYMLVDGKFVNKNRVIIPQKEHMDKGFVVICKDGIYHKRKIRTR